MRLWVVTADIIFRNGQHAAGAAGGVIDGLGYVWGIDVLIARINKVRHEGDDFTRGKVVPGFLIGLFVETADEMFKNIAHLQVAHPVRVQVYFFVGEFFDDAEQAIFVVQYSDFRIKLEFVEDDAHVGRKSVDVRVQIGGQAIGVIQQGGKRVRAYIVKAHPMLLAHNVAQCLDDGIVRHLLLFIVPPWEG